jgi:hypothetical protein
VTSFPSLCEAMAARWTDLTSVRFGNPPALLAYAVVQVNRL